VRDRSISHAIASAYEGLLIRGRYPVAFLFVQIDPREVDVNVHPTKIEVRFHQGQIVYKTVFNAVKEALNAANQIGDDTLQRNAGQAVVPDSFTHGTSAQRMQWFRAGFETGDASGCDTFNAARL